MFIQHKMKGSVVTGRFIRTFRNKIYRFMTSVLNNVYINKLDDINTLQY